MGCWAQSKDGKSEGLAVEVDRKFIKNDNKAASPVPAPHRFTDLLRVSTIDDHLYSDFSEDENKGYETDFDSINVTLNRKGYTK